MSAHDAIDPALLRPRLRTVYVELTSRCNVRCIYCPVSLPAYHGEDLEMDVDDLARTLRKHDLKEVQISGHGETTMLKDWTTTTRKLLEHGLPLTLTTNFAKRMSADELDVLSRLSTLKISVDTADAALLQQLRRGVKLERVEENMRGVLDVCAREFRDPPFLHISCTLSDVAVGGLSDLVTWCVQHRANAIGLVNLVLHEAPAGTIPIRHPSQGDAVAALASIESARELAGRLGLGFSAIPGLVDSVRAACR